MSPSFVDRPIKQHRSFHTQLHSSTPFPSSDVVLVEFLRLDSRQEQKPFPVFLPQHVMKRMLLESIPPDDASSPWELPKHVTNSIITEALHPVSPPDKDSIATKMETASSSYTMEFPRITRSSDLLGSAPDPNFFRQSRRIDPYREDLTKIGHGAEYEIPQDGAYLMANDVWGRPTPTDFWGSTPTQHHKSPFVNRGPIDTSFMKPFTIDERESLSSPDVNWSNPPVTKEPSPPVQESKHAEIFHFRLPMDIVELMLGAVDSQNHRTSTFQVAFPRNLVVQTLAEAVTAMKEDKEEKANSQSRPSAVDDSTPSISQQYSFEGQEKSGGNLDRNYAAYHQMDSENDRDSVQMMQSCSNASDKTLKTGRQEDNFMTGIAKIQDARATAEQQQVASMHTTDDVNVIVHEKHASEEGNRGDLENDTSKKADRHLSKEAIRRIRFEIDTALENHREDLLEEVRMVENQAIQEIQEVKEQIELLSQRLAPYSTTSQGRSEPTLDFTVTVAAHPEPKEVRDVDEIHGKQAAKPSFIQNLVAAKKAKVQTAIGEMERESAKPGEMDMQSVADSYVSNLMHAVKRERTFRGTSAAAVKEIEREIKAAIKSERNITVGLTLHAAPTAVTDDPPKKQTTKRFFET